MCVMGIKILACFRGIIVGGILGIYVRSCGKEARELVNMKKHLTGLKRVIYEREGAVVSFLRD